MERMKNRKRLKIGTFLVFLTLVLSGFIWWQISNGPVARGEVKKKYLVIGQGEGIDEIARKLYKNNLIKSIAAFKIKTVIMGEVKNIQAGAYYLSPSMDLETVVKNLTKGAFDEWVTIPEGLRVEEVAKILSEKLEINRNVFIKLARDYEGYLFPDTYLIPKDFSEEEIFYMVRDNFDKKMMERFGRDIKGREINGFSFRGIIILASLVEREVKLEEDRPIVAGILIKRVKNDWPLQVDATVQYAVASRNCSGKDECDFWPDKLNKKDLNIDSSYNTYKNNSLPPGPICNPGMDAIAAVIEPKETDYWYYLSDRQGKMYYGTTLEEHEANVDKYLTK